MQNNIAEEKILAAAFKVVDENTISGTRMHLIAEEAGMVQSNLHYYFKTKKELLLALLRYLQSDFSGKREYILNRQQKELPDQLSGFFTQKKEIILENPQYDRVQFDFWSLGQVDDEISRSFQDAYDEWRDHITRIIMSYAPEVSEEKGRMAAHIMVSMMMGASMQYLNEQKTFDLEAYFIVCQQMVLQYLEQ